MPSLEAYIFQVAYQPEDDFENPFSGGTMKKRAVDVGFFGMGSNDSAAKRPRLDPSAAAAAGPAIGFGMPLPVGFGMPMRGFGMPEAPDYRYNYINWVEYVF